MRRFAAALVALVFTEPLSALPPPSVTVIKSLTEHLGSDSFPERDTARKKLEAMGERALPALERTAKEAPDAETRRRAGQIAAAVRSRLVERERKKFEGEWQFVGGRRNGNPIPVRNGGWKYVFRGSSVQKLWAEPKQGARVNSEGLYEIGTGGAVDYHFPDEAPGPYVGIYRFDGDTLVICFSMTPGAGRPAKFEAPERSGQILLTLKRQKP